MAPSGYPHFEDGDVEIRLSDTEEPLKLHASILRVYMTWFKASLSERWNPKPNPDTLEPNTKASFNLMFENDSASGTLSRLTKTSSDTEASGADTSSSCSSAKNGDQSELETERRKCVLAHERIFGVLYSVPLNFDADTLQERIRMMRDVLDLADYYGCAEICELYTRDSLSGMQDELLEECESRPLDMLELGLLVKSIALFREAAIYIIGSCAAYFKYAHRRLEELGVGELFEKKRRAFEAELARVDRQLLTFQWSDEYLRDKENWPQFNLSKMAYREYIAEYLGQEYGAGLREEYARVYHYVFSEYTRTMESEFPCKCTEIYETLSGSRISSIDSKEERDFRDLVNDIFDEAREFVRPLLVDRRLGNSLRKEVKELTDENLRFVGVELDEIPWLQSAEEKDAK